MPDLETEPIESMDVDELESAPEETLIKPKRQMSEKQLANLSRAREKAKVVLGVKKKRSVTLRQQERKLRELKLKEKEDRVQAELNTLQTVNVHGDFEEEPVRYVKKPPKKKKQPRVVYYSSSEEDEPEPEIVYKKKVRKPKPIPEEVPEEEETPPPSPKKKARAKPRAKRPVEPDPPPLTYLQALQRGLLAAKANHKAEKVAKYDAYVANL